MPYLAGLLFVLNIAFFAYETTFKPREATAPEATADPAARASLPLVSEVAPDKLIPREDPEAEPTEGASAPESEVDTNTN